MKTRRITFLTTPEFKERLSREAATYGISVAELIHRRCEDKPPNEEEILIAGLVEQLYEATSRAHTSLSKGIASIEEALRETRREEKSMPKRQAAARSARQKTNTPEMA